MSWFLGAYVRQAFCGPYMDVDRTDYVVGHSGHRWCFGEDVSIDRKVTDMWTVFGWISVAVTGLGALVTICEEKSTWYVRFIVLVLGGMTEAYLIKTLVS